jgi:hypothetical protein
MLKEDKKYPRRISEFMEATIVVHNIQIKIGEEERKHWIDENDFSDLDNAEKVSYEPSSDILISDGCPNDERRTRLK